MVKKHLRVLSLGAGVQSTTLALMIEKGEVPMVDCAIFSDTQSEPSHVYKHLDWLEKKLSYPLYKVCLLYTSPSPRDGLLSRMPSSA